MKSLFKNYYNLIGLALICLLSIALFNLGSPAPLCFLLVALWQISQFAMSKRCGVCFTSMLTPEQVREFEGILQELAAYKGLFPSLQDLRIATGGFAAIKNLPDVVAKLRQDLDTHRRASLSRHSGGQLIPGQLVTDDCAEWLAAVTIMAAQRQGKLGLSEHTNSEALLSRAGRVLGLQQKSALTPSDIPMPVGYSGQVIALVNQYGNARRYGTVFPLGTGTVKLPRLKTDTAFGLLARSAAVTEKSPQTEWITFAAEKFGGLIRMPSEMSEDSIIALGNFIAEYAARQIAAVEDQVFFLNLDGSTYGAVKGLCGSTIDNSKVTQMGSTKTHYSDATITNLRTVRNVPDASALRKSAYYAHPSFEQMFAAFNTAGDRPYNPNAQLAGASAAQPFMNGPTFDGFPIRWVDQMPAYSTGANVSKVFILFGDLSFQYLGVTGLGVRFDTSVEAAFDTDEVLIRALERFTIGLMATGAVAGLQTAAS